MKYLHLAANALMLSCIALMLSCTAKRAPVPEYMSVANGYITLNGFALGTYFKISYSDPKKFDWHDSIKALLNEFENSLSVYRQNSLISKINDNRATQPDRYFIAMFNRAKQISTLTDGAFDISASPLFDLWGWGAKKRDTRASPQIIDSLKRFTGMEKIRIENGQIVKDTPLVRLNSNAIAKGYASDVVAEYLEAQGIANYMINIGGEIAVRGKNRMGKDWLIGIDKPIDGNLISGLELQATLRLGTGALATSGDYRRFFIDSIDGQKYAHTIDPRTGYPAKQNILSATVIAPDCMTADAYATAFMVMGLAKTREFLATHPEIEVFLICAQKDTIIEYASEKMKTRFEQ